MLVTFTCDAHETLVMFGDVAQKLLGLMGFNGKSAGEILPADISAVRSRLRDGIKSKTNQIQRTSSDSSQDAVEPEVSLEHRAFPLFEMLDAAEKEKCSVKWKTT